MNFFFYLQGLKKVKAQGIGVHKPDEILEFGQNDLKVLSDVLGDKLYFFGNEPTTVIIFIKKILIDNNNKTSIQFALKTNISFSAGCSRFRELGTIVFLRQRSRVPIKRLSSGQF